MLLERVHWHTLLLVSSVKDTNYCYPTVRVYVHVCCDSVTLLVYFAVVPGPFVIPTTTTTTTPSSTGTLLMIPTGLYDLFSTFFLVSFIQGSIHPSCEFIMTMCLLLDSML